MIADPQHMFCIILYLLNICQMEYIMISPYDVCLKKYFLWKRVHKMVPLTSLTVDVAPRLRPPAASHPISRQQGRLAIVS